MIGISHWLKFGGSKVQFLPAAVFLVSAIGWPVSIGLGLCNGTKKTCFHLSKRILHGGVCCTVTHAHYSYCVYNGEMLY
jgi:hypothetical protein